MRKVMTIIITILLTFPISAFAENDNTAFYSGTWIATNSIQNPDFAFGMLYLAPDHTGRYAVELYNGAERESDYMVLITWKETDAGVDIYSKESLVAQFDLLSMCYIGQKADDDKHIYFAKVYNIYDVLNNGFTLHAGIYTVGKDLPAGDWRFEYQGTGTGEVCCYKNETEYSASIAFPFFDELLGPYVGQMIIGKLPLKDGNILLIKSDMFVMPVESLFP